MTAAWIGERLKDAGFSFENEKEGLGVEEVEVSAEVAQGKE